MSRYIDADGIDIRAREGYDHDGVLYLPYRDVRKSLDTAPSIDIVRCGECRWRKPYSDKQLECGALGLGGLKFPNDFCSYGERTISKMEQVEDEPQREEPPMDEYYKDHDEFYEPQERSSE